MYFVFLNISQKTTSMELFQNYNVVSSPLKYIFRANVSYYRPISNLCIICKMFEKVVYNQVSMVFLGDTPAFCLVLFNNFIAAQWILYILAIVKAFDRINHKTLILKLVRIGICGDLLSFRLISIADPRQWLSVTIYLLGLKSLVVSYRARCLDHCYLLFLSVTLNTPDY